MSDQTQSPHYRDFSGSIIPTEVDLSSYFCTRPFEHVEIMHGYGENQEYSFGDVYVCCSGWLSKKIGNYLKDDLMTIWNSEDAQKIRQSILDGSFSYCNRQVCPYILDKRLPQKTKLGEKYRNIISQNQAVMKEPPSSYFLCYDRSCNLSCPSCRNGLVFFKDGVGIENPLRINEKLISDLFSKPSNRRINLKITGSGDPFASLAFRKLLEQLDGKSFPRLEIELYTNGILCNPHNWEKIKHLEKNITVISVSIDAATSETYALTRKGAWDQLMANMDFISGLKRSKTLKSFATNYVVQWTNYKEVSSFVRLCLSKNVDRINFSFISDWGTWPKDEFNQHCIWNTDHPEFEDFLKVLTDPILKNKIVVLGPLKAYREQALKKTNIFKRLIGL